MNLSTIEKAVYDREIKYLTEKLGKGIEIIREALLEYANCHLCSPYGGVSEKAISATNGDDDKFSKWINSLPVARIGYMSGQYLCVEAPGIESTTVPEFVREAVLRVAVGKFMTQVNSVEEIRELAEQTAYQQNQ